MSFTVKLFSPNNLRDQKFNRVFDDLETSINADLNTFFDQCYANYVLGDVLWVNDLDPIAKVLKQEYYRISFNAIHELFTRPGTFEFFLDVFRAMWGADVQVIFTIIQPGQLKIEIFGSTPALNEILYREIVGNSYVYGDLVTEDDDFLVAQESTGPQTLEELLMIMSELGVSGIYYSPLVLSVDPSEDEGMLITGEQTLATGGKLVLPSSKSFYIPVIGNDPGENIIDAELFLTLPLSGSLILLEGKDSTNIVVLKSGSVDYSLDLKDDMYLTNKAKIFLLVDTDAKRIKEIGRTDAE